MGSRIRPLSPGLPRGITVHVPWKAVPQQPGRLPPGGYAASFLLAPVWPVGLPVTGRSASGESAATSHSGGQRGSDSSPGPGPSSPPSALGQSPRPPVHPAGHDSDSDSELSLDEQSSSYASSHSSDSEDDGVEAEDKWDSARGPVHSTPKGEQVGGAGGGKALCAASTSRGGGALGRLWGPSLQGPPHKAGAAGGASVEALGCQGAMGGLSPGPPLPGATLSSGFPTWRVAPCQACSSGSRGVRAMQGRLPAEGTRAPLRGCGSKLRTEPPCLLTATLVPQWMPQPTTSRPAGPTRAWRGATARSLETSRA